MPESAYVTANKEKRAAEQKRQTEIRATFGNPPACAGCGQLLKHLYFS